jgi:hypothetical protein
MRVVSVLCLLVLIGICVGPAFADKTGPVEKPWSAMPTEMRSNIPEQEPNDACPGQPMECGDRIVPANYSVTSDDDWYVFYATAGTLVTIGTESYNGSDIDTYLELYDINCGARLTYDDDSGPNMFSLITNYTIPQTGYYEIKTFTYSHLYTGDYQLFLTCGVPNPPDPNDTCNPDYAIARCTQGTLNGDMNWDANNYDPGSGGCASGYPEAGKDVAYRMDLNAGDVVNMTYVTPNNDAAFYIITDCANAAGSCVIGADAASGTETIGPWTVPSTGTYWLILDNYGTNMGGAWNLTYDLSCPGPQGACCVNGACRMTYEQNCSGDWLGEGTDCDPNPCPTPSEETSWGQIKATYR